MSVKTFLVFLVLCHLVAFPVFGRVNLTVAGELYKYLFLEPRNVSLSTFPYCYTSSESCDANSSACSVTNEEQSALDVIFDLSINQILAVNERQRSMRIKLTTFLIWTDCRLSWSLERFAIRELHLSIEQFLALGIYVPILLMTEEITPEASKATERSVSVASSGMLHIERMYTTELSCAIDISMYPFDTQVCNITFESVLEKAYVGLKNMESASRTNADGYAQYLSLHHLGMGHFIPSDTWEVVIGPSDGHSRNICVSLDLIDGRGKCLYDVVVHQIVLRRHPTYQLWNLLLPAFLIVIISGCVFLVPPNTSDKMSLSITILLSLFIFMQIMYYKMPETGETLPLLTQYYLICVGLIVLSCISGTLSVILDSAVLPMPKWIRRVIQRYGKRLAPDKISVIHQLIVQNLPMQIGSEKNSSSGTENFPRLARNSSLGAAKQNESNYEWHHVATIFDRFVLIMHVICSVTVLVVYLVRGYVSYINYNFLLSEQGWIYRGIQLKMVENFDGERSL